MGTSAATTGFLSALRRRRRGASRSGTVSPHCRSAGEGDVEVAALPGEPVLVPLGPLAVADALEDAFVDEAVEAVGEHVAGDREARPGSRRIAVSRGRRRGRSGASSARRRPRASARSSSSGPVVAFQHSVQSSTISCITQLSLLPCLYQFREATIEGGMTHGDDIRAGTPCRIGWRTGSRPGSSASASSRR